MITRYHTDAILTCDEAYTLLAPGVIDVEDGVILWVGEPDAAPKLPEAGAVEEWRSGLLMPGLVNVHCHSPMTLFRGAGEDLPIQRWLEDVLWPRETLIEAEDVWWGMTLGAAELLRRGVTTSCEMYWFEESTADAVTRAGLRCVITPGILDVPAWQQFGTWQERIEQTLAFRAAVADNDLIEVGFGPHAAYTLPVKALTAVAEAAIANDVLVHMHVAESRTEGADLEERHGKTVPALLADIGLLDARVLAAHSVWLTDDDLRLYQDHDVAVAHCPQSNAKLGSGVARLADMLALGIRVGLGTDGPASNNDLDLWEEMRLAPMMARAGDCDASLVPSKKALTLATRGGAAALGRDDIGALSPGRKADMILLRTDDPAFVPIVEPEDVVAHAVWSASSRLVTDVWVGGQLVVTQGVCLTVDEKEARREVQSRAVRLAAEAG